MEDLQLQGHKVARRITTVILSVPAVAVIVLSCCPSCQFTKYDNSVEPAPAISTVELKQLVDSGEDIFLLDVRRDSEFVAERLSFTDLRITHDSLKAYLASLPEDKATPIYCFCRGGVRSDHAARYLMSIGYRRVYNVAGGMLAWKKNGYKTVSDPP